MSWLRVPDVSTRLPLCGSLLRVLAHSWHTGGTRPRAATQLLGVPRFPRSEPGGLHHVAISVEHARWQQFKDKLAAADVEVAERGVESLYFRDTDGARIELIADPLGDMYGSKAL